MSYSVAQDPISGTVTLVQDGTYTYTPNATLASTGGPDSFRVTIAEDTTAFRLTGIGGAIQGILTSLATAFGLRQPDTVTVTVPVNVVRNAAPVAGAAIVGTPDPVTGVVLGQVTATDSNGDLLTYSAAATTAKGAVTVNASTGAFTYTPTATARSNAAGSGATAADQADTFTVTVTDGYGGSVVVPVNVAVLPTPNHPPVAGAVTTGTPDATTGVVTGTVTATDPDGNQLSYSGPATTSKGTVNVNASTGAFTYTPTTTARLAAGTAGATAASKTDTFTLTVSDSFGSSTAIPVTVTVSPLNPIQIITADTTWSTGQTIDLTGRNVQVSRGVTLTIQNGVNVTGGTIDVWGTLNVVGTKSNPVTFKNTDVAYVGDYDSPGTLNIAYAVIDGGSIQRPNGNGSHGSLTLLDSTVKNTTQLMYIWYPEGYVDIERNSFINAGGISVGHSTCRACRTGINVNISNNLFVNQWTSFAIENWASYNGQIMSVTGNSFLSQDRIALKLPSGYSGAAISASNNYFGTTDLTIINQMIFDKNDDLSSPGYISTSFTSSPSPNTPSLN